MYYAAVEASCELAAVEGPYSSYAGSPMSKGQMQPDMWGVTPSSRWNWAALKEKVATHGVRNSLLMAPMPTASTAQVCLLMHVIFSYLDFSINFVWFLKKYRLWEIMNQPSLSLLICIIDEC